MISVSATTTINDLPSASNGFSANDLFLFRQESDATVKKVSFQDLSSNIGGDGGLLSDTINLSISNIAADNLSACNLFVDNNTIIFEDGNQISSDGINGIKFDNSISKRDGSTTRPTIKTNGAVRINPPQGSALVIESCNGRASANMVVKGIIQMGHDMFFCSGFAGGFGSSSTHFHNITLIDRIRTASRAAGRGKEDCICNNFRRQLRTYAQDTNVLGRSTQTDCVNPSDGLTIPTAINGVRVGGHAAFSSRHRVSQSISFQTFSRCQVVNGECRYLYCTDVTCIQQSSNRECTDQPFFPSTGSESIFVCFNTTDPAITANSFNIYNSAKAINSTRLSFCQSFDGAIVAANLFSQNVSSNDTDKVIEYKLFGGRYKSTCDSPIDAEVCAINPNDDDGDPEWRLQPLSNTTNVCTNAGAKCSLGVVPKEELINIGLSQRIYSDVLSAKYTNNHGLFESQHITLLATSQSGVDQQEGGAVLKSNLNGDHTAFAFKYGNRVASQKNVCRGYTQGADDPWDIHFASIDGIHQDVITDGYYTFNSDSKGHTFQYTFGSSNEIPGGVSAAAIGTQLYNCKQCSVLIGYGNPTLNVAQTAIEVMGGINFLSGGPIGTCGIPTSDPHVFGSIYVGPSGQLFVSGISGTGPSGE